MFFAHLSDRGGPTAVGSAFNELKKYTFNLYHSDIAMLRELVTWGLAANVTQALRTAIATQYFLAAAAKHGDRIFMESPEEGRRELVLTGAASAPAPI